MKFEVWSLMFEVRTGVLQNGSWAYYSSRKSASRFAPPVSIREPSVSPGVGKKEIGKRISEKNPPCGPSVAAGPDTAASRFLSFPSRPNFHFAELQLQIADDK